MKKLFRKTDLWVIGGILLFAAAIWCVIRLLSASGKTGCRIIYDGKTVSEVNLSIEGEVILPDFPHVTYTVRDGGIAFSHSDCPDKVCVRTGFIYRPYQTAVCLPNKLMVELYPADGLSDTDAVAG